jgi:hypothetical protein
MVVFGDEAEANLCGRKLGGHHKMFQHNIFEEIQSNTLI